MLDDLVDGLDARRPGQLTQLGQLLGLAAGREHRDGEPALGLRAGRRIGLPGRHRWIMPLRGRTASVRAMHVSPVLAAQTTYPFVRIEQAKRERAAEGVEIFDFGQGDPREPTDPLIQQALVDALGATKGYPKAEGLPELRDAIAGVARAALRCLRGSGDRDRSDLGSKEAIFSFAQVVVDTAERQGHGARHRARLSGARSVAPSSPGANVVHVPLLEEHGFLPDLDALDRETLVADGDPLAQLPEQPDRGGRAALAVRARWPSWRRQHDFLVASDEAYSELWFTEPPVSALQVAERTNVVVFNTLSKRSSMTGYRSGFVAGPRWVMDALRAYRPTVGTAPQEFVQRASVVAWSDEAHVERARDVYRRKRDVLLGALEALELARRRERRDDVPLGRGARRARARKGSPTGCSSTASSSHPARISARAAKATSASRSSRPSRTASARPRSCGASRDRDRRCTGRGDPRAARPGRDRASPSASTASGS